MKDSAPSQEMCIVTHRPADANPAQHFQYESDKCDACAQAEGWFPGKYKDVTLVERNRKAIQDEIEWIGRVGFRRRA